MTTSVGFSAPVALYICLFLAPPQLDAQTSPLENRKYHPKKISGFKKKLKQLLTLAPAVSCWNRSIICSDRDELCVYYIYSTGWGKEEEVVKRERRRKKPRHSLGCQVRNLSKQTDFLGCMTSASPARRILLLLRSACCCCMCVVQKLELRVLLSSISTAGFFSHAQRTWKGSERERAMAINWLMNCHQQNTQQEEEKKYVSQKKKKKINSEEPYIFQIIWDVW